MHITEPAADTDAMLPERQRRQVLAALPLLGAALLLAGCGSTPRSSKQAQRRPAPADGQLRARYPQLAARQPVLLDNQLRDGRAGLKVYHAARVDAGAVLVDLGWLPLPADRQLPRIAPLQGRIEVQGLWAPPPSPGLALGPALAATAQPRVWLATRLDIPAIATQLQLPAAALPCQVLRLDPAMPLGYARDLELLPNTLPPSRHLGYAVQWFAMALAVLVIAGVLHVRRRGR